MKYEYLKKILICLFLTIIFISGCSIQGIRDTFDKTINTQFKPNEKEKRRLNGEKIDDSFDYYHQYHMDYSTHTEEIFSTADFICYLDKGDYESAKYMFSPRARDIIPNLDQFLKELVERIGDGKIERIETFNNGGLRTRYDEAYTWATGSTFTRILLKDGSEWELTILTTPYYAPEITNLPDDLLEREKLIKELHPEDKAEDWMDKYYIGIDTVVLQSNLARENSNNHNFYHLDAYAVNNKFDEEFALLFPKGYIGFADIGNEKLNLTKDFDIKYVDFTYGIVLYDK